MQTLRSARHDFFRREGLPTDGGYSDTWFEAGFGSIRYRIRNFPMRSDALMRHDLHHVLTGYRTDWRGEVQINAWELGAGLGKHLWGAAIMLVGFFIGVLLAPIDTFRAFSRGRHSTNLYTVELPKNALDLPPSALGSHLGIAPRSVAVSKIDLIPFVFAIVGSTLFFVLALLPLIGMVGHAAWMDFNRRLSTSCCTASCTQRGIA